MPRKGPLFLRACAAFFLRHLICCCSFFGRITAPLLSLATKGKRKAIGISVQRNPSAKRELAGVE